MNDWPLAYLRVAVRGGGDLGSGVAYRLYRAGFPILITELPQPLLVRRAVCFGSAVIEQQITVEGITARRVNSLSDAQAAQAAGEIPVLIDPDGACLDGYASSVLIDARMLKTDPGVHPVRALLVVGLGPGFSAPQNCDAVIETRRGHTLGLVIWHGSAKPDTGTPESVLGREDRVLRAPTEGIIRGLRPLGARVEPGESLAEVGGQLVVAPFAGVLRGLLHDGHRVAAGIKIGDLDPRAQPAYCFTISDKARAIGGGALEAILSSPTIRERIAQP